MTASARSWLRIEPNALAARQIGPWLTEAVSELDAATAATLLSRAELAVHEACMNVIDHAGVQTGSVLDLDLDLREASLIVRITDTGAPFDLDRVAAPDPLAPQLRGYGVKIIRALATELSYQRLDSKNELTLRFDFDDPTHPD